MKCSKNFIINLVCILPGVQQIVGAGGILVGLFKGLWDTGAEIKATCWNKQACDMTNLKKDGEILGFGIIRFIPIVGTIGSIILAVKTYKKDKANEKLGVDSRTHYNDDVIETKKTPAPHLTNMLKALEEQSFKYTPSDLDTTNSIKFSKWNEWIDGKKATNRCNFLFARNTDAKNQYRIVFGETRDIIIDYNADKKFFTCTHTTLIPNTVVKTCIIYAQDLQSDNALDFALEVCKQVHFYKGIRINEGEVEIDLSGKIAEFPEWEKPLMILPN